MLEIVVVSPARPIYEGEADSIIVESVEGSMGIKPRHADIVAALGAGPLILESKNDSARFAVCGGFLKVGKEKVTILVDQAVRADEIDAEAVRKELDEVIADLAHPKSDEEFEALLLKRRWCQARLRLAS